MAKEKPVKVQWEGKTPKPDWYWWDPEPNTFATQWRTTPTAIDWNKDGLMDLIMLDLDGYLSYYERFEIDNGLMLKPGKRIFYSEPGSYSSKNEIIDSVAGDLRLNERKYGGSGRRKLAFGDWDSDGDTDIIINSINAAFIENTGNDNGKILMSLTGDLTDQKFAGHTTNPTLVDWDKNGKPDLLLGGEDGHFYYLKNE